MKKSVVQNAKVVSSMATFLKFQIWQVYKNVLEDLVIDAGLFFPFLFYFVWKAYSVCFVSYKMIITPIHITEI